MSSNADQILGEALSLPAAERAAIADELLASLVRPEPKIDEFWAREAESRLTEFEAGRMEAFPAEEVFEEFDEP